MNIREWSAMLHCREIGEEITIDESKDAANDNVVIVFGASDDLMEFRGLINDEFGVYNGGSALITTDYEIFNEEENQEELKYNTGQIKNFKKVTAVWCPKDENGDIYASWLITTDIPHETFDILSPGAGFSNSISIHITKGHNIF